MAFESFKSSFKGDIVTAEDAEEVYNKAIARWSHSGARRAKIITFPKDNEDINLALKYARSNGLPVAVKGGGHSFTGQSSAEGGLVIDLSKHLNGVKVDAEKKLAYVGGGAIWETVDREAIKHGLASVSGTVNHTGVGGLTLGGGYGYLTGRHGLALDNVVQATVVVASGEALTASETSNEDLFFGIRGGGGNFGVVTEFVFRLHQQNPTVFAGPLIFAPPAIEALCPALETRRKLGDPDEAMTFGFAVGPDGRPCVLVSLFFNGSEAEARERFKDIYAVGPVVDMAKEIPYEALNSLLNHQAMPGNCGYHVGSAMTTIDTPVVQAAFDKFLEVVDIGVSAGPPGFAPLILLEMWPAGKICSVQKGTTAFNSRGPQFIVLSLAYWKPTEAMGKEDPHLPVVKRLCKSVLDVLVQNEKPIPDDENNIYGNYEPTEPVTSDSLVRLFGSNYPRLQSIKSKYDPDLVFNKWQPIQPA